MKCYTRLMIASVSMQIILLNGMQQQSEFLMEKLKKINTIFILNQQVKALPSIDPVDAFYIYEGLDTLRNPPYSRISDDEIQGHLDRHQSILAKKVDNCSDFSQAKKQYDDFNDFMNKNKESIIKSIRSLPTIINPAIGKQTKMPARHQVKIHSVNTTKRERNSLKKRNKLWRKCKKKD